MSIISVRTVFSFIIILVFCQVSLSQRKEVENLVCEFITQKFNFCDGHSFIELGEYYFFEFENLDVKIKKSRISKAEKVTRILWKGSFQIEYDLFREIDCDENYHCNSTKWRTDSISHTFKYVIRLFKNGKNEVYPLVKSVTERPSCQEIELLTIMGSD